METRTRIAGIIIKDGKILLQRGKGYPELWTPGGKIEEGESDETCLVRELREELGVEIKSLKFFKEYDDVSFYNPNKRTIERVYIVDILGEPKADNEIEELIWFSKDDYKNKKYEMITHTERDMIPDLIKEEIW